MWKKVYTFFCVIYASGPRSLGAQKLVAKKALETQPWPTKTVGCSLAGVLFRCHAIHHLHHLLITKLACKLCHFRNVSWCVQKHTMMCTKTTNVTSLWFANCQDFILVTGLNSEHRWDKFVGFFFWFLSLPPDLLNAIHILNSFHKSYRFSGVVPIDGCFHQLEKQSFHLSTRWMHSLKKSGKHGLDWSSFPGWYNSAAMKYQFLNAAFIFN